MAVTYGFYNSINGDRTYSAEQMGSIFDGIIKDGVYQGLGEAFKVTASTGMTVNVGSGRAWFDHTWTLNDTKLPVTLDAAHVLLPRIDSIVIEINKNTSSRANSVKVLKGSPSSSPIQPALTRNGNVRQYRIANVTVNPGAISIKQSDISYKVGSEECPFVIGVLESLSIENFTSSMEAKWLEWFTTQKASATISLDSFTDQKTGEFTNWFGSLKSTLDGDVAAKLSSQIVELQNSMGETSNGTVVYQGITDSNGNSILDNYNQTLLAKLIYVLK